MPSKRGSRGGARVRRGQTAAAAQAAPPIHNVYVAVEEALQEPARQRILDWCNRTNPHYRGAHVADILDRLYDSDAYLGVVEPYWELHGERLADELGAGWQVVGVAATAAVILIGLTVVASDPLWPGPDSSVTAAMLPPREYCELVGRLARAAAAGENGTVAAPDVREMAGWLAEDGTVIVRHHYEELMALELSGECDDCVHPQGDHDPTGACLRVNPFMGPCPCRHTPDEVRAQQERLFEQSRRTERS